VSPQQSDDGHVTKAERAQMRRAAGLGSDVRRYHTVPADYEAHIPQDLRLSLGMPRADAGGSDNLSRIKAAYEELGPDPSLHRYGWVQRATEG
jgi:hypothetical protein